MYCKSWTANFLVMDCNDKDIEQQLSTIIGQPEYYIDTPGLKENEVYYWFPTLGDSMTNDTPRSIPGGSLVLGRRLNFTDIKDIPLHVPVVVMLQYAGEQFCLLKSVCDMVSRDTRKDHTDVERLCLHSYNPAPRYDDLWVPFSCIQFIFVVEKVRCPGGYEFIPQEDKVLRKQEGIARCKRNDPLFCCEYPKMQYFFANIETAPEGTTQSPVG